MPNILLQLLNSEQKLSSPSGEISDIKNFVQKVRDSIKFSVNYSKFSNLTNWSFSNGMLQHTSGGFFKIKGLRQTFNDSVWNQPIIDQPEIGYLGIITKVFDDSLYFLLQAKLEPGNINGVQLSPTLQATKSNFSCLHNGKPPKYIDNFIKARNENILVDQLQSEQGARFLTKKNRNIIIIDQDVEVDFDNFIWVSLGQLRHLIQEPNLINMDTRTVLSGLSFMDYSEHELFYYLNKNKIIYNDFFMSEITNLSADAMNNIHSKIANIKFSNNCNREIIPLENMTDWIIDDEKIYHKDDNYFSIIPLDITISNREVLCWSQPILRPSCSGYCIFIVKKINNVMHFLSQIKFECGNLDFFEIGPSVQCLQSNLKDLDNFFIEIIYDIQNESLYKIHHDSFQSEEGGRFLNDSNRNIIVELISDNQNYNDDNFLWLTLCQLKGMLKFSNVVNIQARNLISLIKPFDN